MSSEFRENSAEDEQPPAAGSGKDRQRVDVAAWGNHLVNAVEMATDAMERARTAQISSSPSGDGAAGGPIDFHPTSSDDPAQFLRVLDAYQLDKQSIERAVTTGGVLAHLHRSQLWAEASPEERKRVYEEFAGHATMLLDREPSSPMIAEDMARRCGVPAMYPTHESGVQGIAIDRQLLAANDALPLVYAVAHEARHRWQDDVIAGELEHPDGEPARARLMAAHAEYDFKAVGASRNFHNELELDARAYAIVAAISYADESKIVRKQELSNAAGELLTKDSVSKEEDT